MPRFKCAADEPQLQGLQGPKTGGTLCALLNPDARCFHYCARARVVAGEEGAELFRFFQARDGAQAGKFVGDLRRLDDRVNRRADDNGGYVENAQSRQVGASAPDKLSMSQSYPLALIRGMIKSHKSELADRHVHHFVGSDSRKLSWKSRPTAATRAEPRHLSIDRFGAVMLFCDRLSQEQLFEAKASGR